MTYRDSTDDGFEGEMLEGGQEVTDFELVDEADRVIVRLSFLTMLARLWKLTAVASMSGGGERSGRDDVLAQWLRRATINRRRLSALLGAVHHYRILAPRGTFERWSSTIAAAASRKRCSNRSSPRGWKPPTPRG